MPNVNDYLYSALTVERKSGGDSAIVQQKTIGLNTLVELGAKKCSFNELRNSVLTLRA
jgi:hypothetical protein